MTKFAPCLMQCFHNVKNGVEGWLTHNLLPHFLWQNVLNCEGDRVFSAIVEPLDYVICITAYLQTISADAERGNVPTLSITVMQISDDGRKEVVKDKGGELLAAAFTNESYDTLETDLSNFVGRLNEFVRALAGNPTFFEPLAIAPIAPPCRRPEAGPYGGLHIV